MEMNVECAPFFWEKRQVTVTEGQVANYKRYPMYQFELKKEHKK